MNIVVGGGEKKNTHKILCTRWQLSMHWLQKEERSKVAEMCVAKAVIKVEVILEDNRKVVMNK